MRLTASAFRKLLSIFVFSYFPFGFEGRMWDLIVSVPDHCLSFFSGNKFHTGIVLGKAVLEGICTCGILLQLLRMVCLSSGCR